MSEQPTPETDGKASPHIGFYSCATVPADFARRLERERDEWKAKYIQQNKDLGCELRDPNGTIWDHAQTLQRDLTAVTKERDESREELRAMARKALEGWQ